jgi:hypothetical protein
VQATLQAETRVQLRIERLAHDEFVTDGDAFLGWPALVEIGEEEGASEQVVRTRGSAICRRRPSRD